MAMMGKVAMLVAPGKFEIQEYPVPEIGDDEMKDMLKDFGVQFAFCLLIGGCSHAFIQIRECIQ